MKKAQTEIIGVAFIVLILVIAGGFMISSSITKKENAGENYQSKELANSLLNAMMNTETEKNLKISDIIIDGCYNNRRELCGNQDCCKYVHDLMEKALTSTLAEWKMDYKLQVTRQGTKKIDDIPQTSKCGRYTESNKAYVIIPSSPSITVTLEIC